MQVLVPLCCFCEKVRDDEGGVEVGQGRWVHLKTYHVMHNLLPDEVWFSHTSCPDCDCRRLNVRVPDKEDSHGH
jgi:hypothetical protein